MTITGQCGATAALFEKMMAPFLCGICLTGFMALESPVCPLCGIMFAGRQGQDHVCGDCLVSPRRFGMVRSTGFFEQSLMEAVHCLKYSGKIQLAQPLGMLLFVTFIRNWEKEPIDRVIPVPLHIKRMRMRGFNQTFLMVRHWPSLARAMKVERPVFNLDTHTLFRKRWTEPQTGLARTKRLKNIKNAFDINDPVNIAGQRILLVDDVFTTGATVDACAKVLLNGGAERVDVLTLARAR